MTIWQNIFSTFIGVLAGFLFSIALFYFTTTQRRYKSARTLAKNLNKEFEYNINFLKNIISDLNKSIEKIASDDDELHMFFDYKYYQRLFLQAYFQQGYLYDKLDPEDIILLDTILSHMAPLAGNWINEHIQMWEKKQITKQRVTQVLSFERDTLEGFIKNIQTIKRKISGSSKT